MSNETLMQSPGMVQPIVDLVLPAKHVYMRLVRANETYLFGSRGSFKTSRGIALFVVDMVYAMPRSSGALVGLSFEHLGDNTMPPLLVALQEFGFRDGEHFVVGKRPPQDWEKPFLGVYEEKYDHVMTWHNGTVVHLISLAKKASANGISAQWGVFDETKFMKPEQLREIMPIFRGNEKHFAHLSTYLSKFFATDKLADPIQIQWLLDKRKLHDQRKIDVIIPLQLAQNKLREEYADSGTIRRAQLKKKIDLLEGKLAKLRSRLTMVVEISAYDVLPILGKRWLADKKRNHSEQVFDVAFANQDPETAGDTFYPNYSKAHQYQSLEDIDPYKSFIIAPDYQHSVAPIPLAQLSVLPGRTRVSLNYVDEVYTLGKTSVDWIQPNGNGKKGQLAEAVQLFCDRYQDHKMKKVYYVYDATAVGKRVGIDEYYKIVVGVLKKNSWRVVKVSTGKPPAHYLKYTRTAEWLKYSDPSLFEIMVNTTRCVSLHASIKSSPAKTTNGKTEKDKQYENTNKYPLLDQSKTTHFSDTFDMINHAVLFLKMIKVVQRVGGTGLRS